MSAKDEVKKAVEAATRKAERDVKAAKDEAAAFKSKADELELKISRVSFFFILWEL